MKISGVETVSDELIGPDAHGNFLICLSVERKPVLQRLPHRPDINLDRRRAFSERSVSFNVEACEEFQVRLIPQQDCQTIGVEAQW
jgi:hypothetical protein